MTSTKTTRATTDARALFGEVIEGNGKVGDRVGAGAEREVVVCGVACVFGAGGRRLLVVFVTGSDEGDRRRLIKARMRLIRGVSQGFGCGYVF